MKRTVNNFDTLTLVEKRIVSEEYAKATLEKQLTSERMREYKIAANNGKNGGMA